MACHDKEKTRLGDGVFPDERVTDFAAVGKVTLPSFFRNTV